VLQSVESPITERALVRSWDFTLVDVQSRLELCFHVGIVWIQSPSDWIRGRQDTSEHWCRRRGGGCVVFGGSHVVRLARHHGKGGYGVI
jgi:hypothetical protein